MRHGQVLVVVMLVLAIAMTVALAISSRSITEVAVSTTQDESSRALEAAQAGLERYLGGVPYPTHIPAGGGGDLSGMNASYFVPNATTMGGGNSYQIPYSLIDGDIATVDLPDGSTVYNGFRVCWGSGFISPKIEVAIFYRTVGGEYLVRRKAYDPAGNANWRNFVSTGTASNCGTATSYNYNVTINFNSDGGHNILLPPLGAAGNRIFFTRIRLMGNGITGQPLAVQLIGAGVSFPTQAGLVESVGTSGDTVQKIRATVTVWDLPAVFDAAVFSGAGLSK